MIIQFLELLALLFIGLKLDGAQIVSGLSWWWLIMPVWLLIVAIVSWNVGAAVYVIMHGDPNKAARKHK